jgi:gas vesicle protein
MGRAASFILGFTIGAAAGTIAALLLAPKSGEETIHDLQARGIELKSQVQTQAERLAEEARVRAEQAAGEVRTRVPHSGEQGNWTDVTPPPGRVVLGEKARREQESLDKPDLPPAGTNPGV